MIAALFIALGSWCSPTSGSGSCRPAGTRTRRTPGRRTSNASAVGFFANFFDALGIGSFATTTTYFRLRKLVRDELIPGSLNVGYALPTATQAFIGIAVIEVDPMTLVLMIATAVAGSWFGAGRVAHWPRRAIQIGMGIALLVAAFFFLARLLQWMPSSDEGTLDLTGTRLVLGLAGSFLLGTIMPLGIGYYAPCMILVSALGMNPRAAFPIMMGACAFLMPVASMNFIRNRRYSLQVDRRHGHRRHLRVGAGAARGQGNGPEQRPVARDVRRPLHGHLPAEDGREGEGARRRRIAAPEPAS